MGWGFESRLLPAPETVFLTMQQYLLCASILAESLQKTGFSHIQRCMERCVRGGEGKPES